MGTLMGHILPGSFFLLFGLWWCYCMMHNYYICRKEMSLGVRGHRVTSRYKSSLLFTCSFRCCRKLPLEAILLVSSCIIGIIGEAVTGFKDGQFVHLGNGQHITMYSFFALMALVSILMHYRFPLPPDTDYVVALIAISVEGILFLYHLHGRTSLDVQVHMFLVYVVGACAASGALEMAYKSNVLPALARAFFIVMQGTWFIHVGFILYPPSWMKPWDGESHPHMMIVTMMFTWHFAAVFIVFFVIGALVYTRTKYMTKNQIMKALDIKYSRSEHSVNGIGLHASKLNDEQTRNIILDSDEDEI